MTIQYLHASKFGNGATVAAEFKRRMAAKSVAVEVHHIRDAKPSALAPADLYLFSSPGRMGRPIGGMRRFLKKVQLPAGTRYALLTTEMAPRPDKKTGRMPTEEELARRQRIRPLMNEALQGKELVPVAEEKVHVTGLKGPLEDGWEEKVGAFASRIALGVAVEVHHIRDATPSALAPADLYVLSSPGRMGRPIRSMRRFLKKVQLPAGTRYALLTTEMAPKPDKKTGRMPTEEELASRQRIRPLMNELLQAKGLVHVAEDKVHVNGLKGPLEDEWEEKVGAFASRIALGIAERPEGHLGAPAEASAA